MWAWQFKSIGFAAMAGGLPGCGLIPLAALSTAGAVADVSTAVISTGSEVYAYGKLSSVELATLTEVADAVRSAARELQLTIEKDIDVEHGRAFELLDERGSNTKIKIERRTPALCQLKIDVGFFGSEPLSRLLLNRIRARLPREHPGPATLPNKPDSAENTPA